MEVSGQFHAPDGIVPGKEPPISIGSGAGYAVPCDLCDGRLFCHLQLACSFSGVQDAGAYKRMRMASALQSSAMARISRSFLNFLQSVGLFGRRISPSLGRYLHTGQLKPRTNTHRHPYQVGFEPTILVFEQAKTVHSLDRVATVTGEINYINTKNNL
jgi:hypothetical protein